MFIPRKCVIGTAKYFKRSVTIKQLINVEYMGPLKLTKIISSHDKFKSANLIKIMEAKYTCFLYCIGVQKTTLFINLK